MWSFALTVADTARIGLLGINIYLVHHWIPQSTLRHAPLCCFGFSSQLCALPNECATQTQVPQPFWPQNDLITSNWRYSLELSAAQSRTCRGGTVRAISSPPNMRLLIAVFVHTGFQHVLSNLLVWLALAMPLEYAYGTCRILAVWLISALGSAFFSAAFEDSCTLACHCLPSLGSPLCSISSTVYGQTFHAHIVQ